MEAGPAGGPHGVSLDARAQRRLSQLASCGPRAGGLVSVHLGGLICKMGVNLAAAFCCGRTATQWECPGGPGARLGGSDYRVDEKQGQD